MRRINILILFILITLGSYAQNILVFDSSTFNIGIINHLTPSITISDSIYNDSSFVFTGPLTFGARVNSFAASPPQFTNTYNASDTIFNPGVRKPVTFTVHDSLPPGGGFIIGPNTIVIWPIYNRGLTPFGAVDSIYIHATYDTVSGITGTSLLQMYIFQTPGRLNVNFGDAENLVQQVRIYDILGQGIYAGPVDRSKNIPTIGWNTGIYLCEITTFTGEKRTIKFRLE